MIPTRRFLVAHAPMRLPGERPTRERKPRCIPARVAVYPWAMPEHALSVIVRVALPLGAKDESAFVSPSAWSIGARVDGVRVRPDDFVPLRPNLDLLLTGNVDMGGAPSGGVWARRASIGFGEATESLVIASGAPGRVPLRPPYTRWIDGTHAEVGPGPATSARSADGVHPEGFDFDAYQSAPAPLQFDGMPVGEPLVLADLFGPGETVETMMPDLAPRLLVDPAEPDEEPRDVVMRLDTVLVDCDARIVDLTWRGFLAFPKPARRSVDRLIVAWVKPTEWKEDAEVTTWRGLLRELPRGDFFWATERDDVVRGREPEPLSEEEALMARYASWDQVAAATPTIEMEQRARIAAELAEGREPRKDVLFRHGLDEHAWALEERATVEELSRPASTPDEAARQRSYAESFIRAQDALARPEEDAMTLPRFARLLALVERGLHEAELAELGLGLGAIFRLERKWRLRAESDPQVKHELDEALERERAAAALVSRPELEDLAEDADA